MKKNKKRAYHCLAPESGRIFRLLHLHHTSHKEPFAGFLRVVTFVFLVMVGLVVAVGSYGIGYNFHRITHPITIQEAAGIEDAVAKSIRSVVHIVNETQFRQGSGVAITKNLIVTAGHVVNGGGVFTITDNTGRVYKSYRAVSSKKHDIGFIQVTEPNLVPSELGSIKDCVLGQIVYSIGSTYGKVHMNAVAVGNIQTLNLDLEKFGCPIEYKRSFTFSHTAEGGAGNSGCPLFTLDGKIRGIWIGSMGTSVHYCIPVDVFMDEIKIVDLLFGFDRYKYEKAEVFIDAF